MVVRGKGDLHREVPLFPEFRVLLADAFESAKAGETLVLPHLRLAAGGGAVRNVLVRAIRRAGLRQWPRLWHNLRVTRATELADRFPLKVVTTWMGHDVAIAVAHYHRVTEEHYATALQNQTSHLPAQAGTGNTPRNMNGITPQENAT